ncbi:GGDEF domain-containing protein [Noviherbaspirillum soli]|uniref:GGDEF domain-containing protein n=1 Tax=Noviherbaspirillum soli TaxID=1064518 RepID=UPI00188D3A6C|nr:GGDEF domain-containing protein [Noviherbaspirillum soli]
MPTFDPRSFIITSAVAGILCSMIFFVLRRSFPREIGGIGEWGWGCVAMVGGAFLFAFRDTLSPLLTVVLANTLIVGGIVLMHVSLRRFTGLRAGYGWAAGLLLAVAAGLLWLTMVADNYRGRLEFITSINTLLFGLSAWFLFRMKKQGFAERFTGALFAVEALVSLGRFYFALAGQNSDDYWNDNSMVHMFYLASFSIALVGLSFGFMLMVTTRVQEKLEYAASHDDLSGAYTRATFFRMMAGEVLRARRQRRPLSLLLIDIDDFKRINDGHGHPVGDAVIRTFATVTAGELRAHDLLCRYGGEEFALLLPDTALDEATAVAERIRARFSEGVFDGLPSFTASLGVQSAEQGALEVAQMIEGADRALYIAKKLGKNRVEIAPEVGHASGRDGMAPNRPLAQ